jgi:hypothetical protein
LMVLIDTMAPPLLSWQTMLLEGGVITLFHNYKVSKHPGITKTLQLISPIIGGPILKPSSLSISEDVQSAKYQKPTVIQPICHSSPSL